MATYLWQNWHQQISYDWQGWVWDWFGFKPRWTNPTCDVKNRHVDKTLVGSSEPREWPSELRDLNLAFGPVAQKPMMGSVPGSVPMQMVDPNKTTTVTVGNNWGGWRFKNGVKTEWLPAGTTYDVIIPTPMNNGLAHEGYPNHGSQGDRHWYGIEPDGTAHECIWMQWGPNWWDHARCLHYMKYDPQGNMIDGIPGGGNIVKGGIQWTAHAWNRYDEPHRLGCVIHNMGGGDGWGDPYNWDFPRYGQVFRLSEDRYKELYPSADEEQRRFLDSLRHYGVVPFDTGGNGWFVAIAEVGGAQWVGSTLGELDIPVSDLELVTG